MSRKQEYLATGVAALVFGLIAAVGGVLAIAQVAAPPQSPAPRAKDNAPDAQQAQAAGQRQPAATAAQETQPRAAVPRQQAGAAAGQPRFEGRDRRESRASDVAWLGVYLQGSEEGQTGARVTHVYPAGPAARSGFQPGDIITQVNGQQIADPQDLISTIEGLQPQSKAEIIVRRGNQDVKLAAVLGSRDSYMFRNQNEGQYGENTDEDDFYSNIPSYAMELEHNRRMAEQHQRIEEELRKLQEEVRQLREVIQAKK